MPIQTNDRVVHCGHPGYGYGTVKLVEENLLGDECICQVAFEWVPGLVGTVSGLGS